MVSHELASEIAACQTSCGKDSPNHTTSGLRILPHLHIGGSSEKLDDIMSLKSHDVHFIVIILPWSSYTFLLPALWCKPSMFCVKTRTGFFFSRSAIAICPAFGFAASMFLLLSSYHSQTSFGSS